MKLKNKIDDKLKKLNKGKIKKKKEIKKLIRKKKNIEKIFNPKRENQMELEDLSAPDKIKNSRLLSYGLSNK